MISARLIRSPWYKLEKHQHITAVITDKIKLKNQLSLAGKCSNKSSCAVSFSNVHRHTYDHTERKKNQENEMK